MVIADVLESISQCDTKPEIDRLPIYAETELSIKHINIQKESGLLLNC